MFVQARNLTNKLAAALTVGAVGLIASPAFAQAAAADPVGDIFAAVNLATVSVAVIGIGVVVMGIVMAYKGIDLGKRAVSKA